MRPIAIASIACLAASLGAVAADDPKQRQDLTAVIALNGKACGEVVSYAVQGENDFVATVLHESGYRSVLQLEPNHAGALHLLGLLTQQCGDIEVAAVTGVCRGVVTESADDGQANALRSGLVARF